MKHFTTSNAAVNALLRALDGGRLLFFSGAQPASANDPVPETAVLLAEGKFPTPAYSAAVGGRATARIISDPAHAVGRVDWVRAVTAESAAIFDASAGASADYDVVIEEEIPSIHAGVVVDLSFELPTSAGASNVPGPAAARPPAVAHAPIDSRDVYSRLNRRGR